MYTIYQMLTRANGILLYYECNISFHEHTTQQHHRWCCVILSKIIAERNMNVVPLMASYSYNVSPFIFPHQIGVLFILCMGAP